MESYNTDGNMDDENPVRRNDGIDEERILEDMRKWISGLKKPYNDPYNPSEALREVELEIRGRREQLG